jgi:hypothetical protein
MTIEIHRPELAALIRERINSGVDVEDVIMQALQSSCAPKAATPTHRPAGRKSLAQVFADSPFKGLNIDFEREPGHVAG